MTTVTSTSLTFTGHGDDLIQAERFDPPGGAGPTSAVVLVHEVFGLDAFARDTASRLAEAGHVVMVPDLYSREGLPGPGGTPDAPAPEWTEEQILRASSDIPDRRAVSDLEAAVSHLAGSGGVDPERIGALGLGLGGKLALLLGCQSRQLAAVVDFYGPIRYADLGPLQPVQPLEMTLNLSCPLLAIFGENDPTIPIADVEDLREKMTAFAKPAEIVVVPGVGHGFMNHLRSSWSEAASPEAWARTLGFLEEVLAAD